MDRRKILCAALAFICMGGTFVSAQGGYEIRGVVADQLGPVIGAAVVEQGTSNGTSTGLDGDYALSVSGPSALVEISCIGYKTRVFEAASVPPTVMLQEDTEMLEETVVIGYGTVRKDDMTGSISAIKAEDINRGAVVNTQDMLKGKVAGLLVTPGDGGPGSSSRIRIRGAASLNASNDPLIVIDGVPVAQGAGGAMSNPLDLLNPNDIESFSILKDASSAAIYGSRASNGVILITTKKGRGTKPQIAYNGSISIQQVSKRIPAMSKVGELSERAGVAAPAEITADFLVAERARELMWEGHRRTDLIRFGLYSSADFLWPYKGGDSFAGQAFPDYKCIFPIPPTELATNDKLVQNPGY